MRQPRVKVFSFDEDARARARGLIFSDPAKIRLNPETHLLELRATIDPTTGRAVYPTDSNLSVTLWASNPKGLRQWRSFHAEPYTQPTGTSIGFKLNNGTADLYWNGLAWASAGASNWNTLAEVAEHVATFPIGGRTIRVVCNLKTTDPTVTPTIEAIGVLMDVDMDSLGSVLLDSLIPSLRETMRPVLDLAITVQGGTKISLRDLETPYNIVDVSEVYNRSTDPELVTNLRDTWDPVGKVVSVTTAFAAGEKAHLRITVEPEAVLNWPDQDFVEVEKVPAVIVDSVTVSGNQIEAKAWVKNLVHKEARVLRRPFRLKLEVDILLLAERNRTLFAMIEQAKKHGARTPLLRWRAVDEELTFTVTREAEVRPRPDLRDAHSAGYSCTIEEVYVWLSEEEIVPLVERFNLTLSAPDLESGPRYVGSANY